MALCALYTKSDLQSRSGDNTQDSPHFVIREPKSDEDMGDSSTVNITEDIRCDVFTYPRSRCWFCVLLLGRQRVSVPRSMAERPCRWVQVQTRAVWAALLAGALPLLGLQVPFLRVLSQRRAKHWSRPAAKQWGYDSGKKLSLLCFSQCFLSL